MPAFRHNTRRPNLYVLNYALCWLTDISYAGQHNLQSGIDIQSDASLGPTHERSPRLLRISVLLTWQSISASRFGSHARMDVTMARV